MKEIIIFGTGDYATRMFYNLKSIGCQIAFFCRTSAQDNENYLGKAVINLARLKEKIHSNSLVIIAIKDTQAFSEIKQSLLEMRLGLEQIIDVRNFFQDNIISSQVIRTNGEELFYCNCCNHFIDKFLPSGKQEEVFQTYQIVGGGIESTAFALYAAQMIGHDG